MAERRYAVVIDDPVSGPCFLPRTEDGLPLIFPSWEDAWEAGLIFAEGGALPPLTELQVIRLLDR